MLICKVSAGLLTHNRTILIWFDVVGRVESRDSLVNIEVTDNILIVVIAMRPSHNA